MPEMRHGDMLTSSHRGLNLGALIMSQVFDKARRSDVSLRKQNCNIICQMHLMGQLEWIVTKSKPLLTRISMSCQLFPPEIKNDRVHVRESRTKDIPSVTFIAAVLFFVLNIFTLGTVVCSKGFTTCQSALCPPLLPFVSL